ncbi:Crp/Fnr family transcriptional regulator [Halioglobus japonicus]|uniref:Fumarate/nitrate reduction transcriptional regulator Fnr n=1 Tax=Halioglobus japonicus TaxID=930805 RepID=A0AAP8MF06_9GAMM|nr:fumarate/nitrate reduction transcriptional regulator Fnr [Halioglobus japonicus]AQA18455.1 Crp/Fnr family transcriptional regulator [Halioglobus japonicus]PLW86469.1 fumarate/nitrate reduction transcriptional regulator Fnr [Halioglobus japonicus]GHD12682.1 transcriptional activator protein anr [Halioglobus japonicus]
MTNIAESRSESYQTCTHDPQVSCGNCRLNSICLPLALESDDIAQLDDIIQRCKPLQKNQHLYREGDDFESVFAVRSGTLKAYKTTDDDREQVTGFYFPGEILGMDGISNNSHASSAKALETAAICEIPFTSLEKLSALIPNLQRHFFQLMSHEITEDQQLITLLSKNSADERVAALLLSISGRNARRKLSATQFRLPMSRVDIGNYLGLTVETVSRVFSRLQKMDILQVDNKEIEILDSQGLRNIANLSS